MLQQHLYTRQWAIKNKNNTLSNTWIMTGKQWSPPHKKKKKCSTLSLIVARPDLVLPYSPQVLKCCLGSNICLPCLSEHHSIPNHVGTGAIWHRGKTSLYWSNWLWPIFLCLSDWSVAQAVIMEVCLLSLPVLVPFFPNLLSDGCLSAYPSPNCTALGFFSVI